MGYQGLPQYGIWHKSSYYDVTGLPAPYAFSPHFEVACITWQALGKKKKKKN